MLLSGGIDSATSLYLCRAKYSVRALTYEYHGMAEQELRSAGAIAERAGVLEHRVVRLPDLREAADIPGARFERLPPTYIPSRNAVFYSLAASYAEETGAAAIVGGHNKDDGAVFRDVSSEFFDHLKRALVSGSARLEGSRLEILRPLEGKTKVEVIRLASSLGVPLELTWSCHREGDRHCWRCPGCDSRARAFSEAGVPDPIPRTKRKIT